MDKRQLTKRIEHGRGACGHACVRACAECTGVPTAHCYAFASYHVLLLLLHLLLQALLAVHVLHLLLELGDLGLADRARGSRSHVRPTPRHPAMHAPAREAALVGEACRNAGGHSRPARHGVLLAWNGRAHLLGSRVELGAASWEPSAARRLLLRIVVPLARVHAALRYLLRLQRRHVRGGLSVHAVAEGALRRMLLRRGIAHLHVLGLRGGLLRLRRRSKILGRVPVRWLLLMRRRRIAHLLHRVGVLR